MPPVIMAKVTPMPINVIVLVCRARERMLRIVKKFFATIEKMIKSTITATKGRKPSRVFRMAFLDRLDVSTISGASSLMGFDVISFMALSLGLVFGLT